MAIPPRQQRFCEEYLVDLNGTQAAIRAGYAANSANEQASRLLAKSNIQEFIKLKQAEIQKRLDITQDRVLKEYARIAFFDVRKIYSETNSLKPVNEMDDDSAACVAGIEADEIFEGYGEDRKHTGYTVKVKLASKIAALDSLAKHLGLFEKDNGQKKSDVIQPMSNDQVEKVIKALRSKAKA
ncbi:MAG: terminase small subunit [Chitinophagia bacterium]